MKPAPPLDRRFRLVVFDWDGTAVASRSDDAAPVRGPIERLLRCGVPVVVVSGTNLRNIDGQLSRAIRGRHERGLYLATNRGSEVYGFDERSAPTLLWRRAATPEEDRALTRIADRVRDALVARTGLDVDVIHDRLNRRKVDLIPVDAWRDPPKSALGELLVAVETRLRSAGVAGLAEVIELARTTAREQGLPDAKITSDVKHVEIGLTDKGDSLAWVMRELAGPAGIDPVDVLVGGDEFGPIAGFPGSDSRMQIPECAGATFVSVGPEPGGVPDGVLHLGGGPERFRELLGAQAALHPVTLPATPTRDPEWVLVEDGWVLAREHEIESLFAIGNGFVGSRGALAEGSALSSPATFVAGLFEGEAATAGLARLPDWTRLSGEIDGRVLRMEPGRIVAHQRVLDLRQGILWRRWRHRDDAGRVTSIEGMRLASLADRHLLLQFVSLTPENHGARLTVEVEVPDRPVSMRTRSGHTVELATESHLETPEGWWTVHPSDPSATRARWTLQLDLGKTGRFDRIVSVRTSREPVAAPPDPPPDARQQDVEVAVEEHRAAWRDRWADSDLRIEGDPQVQRAVRFAAYHLISAANPEDERVSIGARGLTGGVYKGHVFWDTEVFMLPFYALTWPEAARALLMYRYHTLPAARTRAARLGYQGALYAWESAETGEDVTPPYVVAPTGELVRIRVAEQEQHIDADVAWAVWGYWRATADDPFLLAAGAEILLETARFWASRARREEDGQHHIRTVIGPDEYHESVDDDAYTNGMARWNLRCAAEAASLLARRWPERWRELSEQLRLDPDEPRAWRAVADGLYLGLDPRTGLIEQFQGYFELEDIDLRAFVPRTAPIDVLLGRQRIQGSQVIKQPGVVLLLYLLADRFPREVREANFRYYEPRTAHGSSLSPAIHAAVAARLGDLPLAERYLRQSIEIDLGNSLGNAAGGVHLGALGGLWQAVVFGFAGLALTEAGPTVDPRLPAEWRGLRFAVRWRGRRFPIELGREEPMAEVQP